MSYMKKIRAFINGVMSFLIKSSRTLQNLINHRLSLMFQLFSSLSNKKLFDGLRLLLSYLLPVGLKAWVFLRFLTRLYWSNYLLGTHRCGQSLMNLDKNTQGKISHSKK